MKVNAALRFGRIDMWKKYSINLGGKLWEIVLFCVKYCLNKI